MSFVNFLLLTIMLWLSGMLSLGESGWRVYESSLYYFCNFSVSLKLLQIKTWKSNMYNLWEFQNISWKILFKWSQIWEFWFQPLFFRVNHFISLNFLHFRHIIHLCFCGLHSLQILISLKLWWSSILIDIGQSMPY